MFYRSAAKQEGWTIWEVVVRVGKHGDVHLGKVRTSDPIPRAASRWSIYRSDVAGTLNEAAESLLAEAVAAGKVTL